MCWSLWSISSFCSVWSPERLDRPGRQPERRFTFYVFSLPARGDDALELRLLLCGPTTRDSIVPAQAGICRELSHGLDELIHLRAEQHLAIASLNRLRPIGCADIPVLYGNLIGRAMNRQAQIVGLPTNDEIQRIDATIERHLVGRAAAILNEILSTAELKVEGVVARPANEGVVAGSAVQGIVARAPVQGVVPAGAGQHVVARVAGEGKPGTECRRVHVQRRRAGRQPCRIGDHHALYPRDARRYHQGLPGGGAGEADHIRARPPVDHLARAVLCGSPDQEHIVPVPPVQRIVARPAVQRVVARAAVQRVRAIRADQEIGGGVAGDGDDPPSPDASRFSKFICTSVSSGTPPMERDLVDQWGQIHRHDTAPAR